MSCALLRGLLREEDGPTASEYAVMLALIVGALITAINSVGSTTSQGWSHNATTIINAASGPLNSGS
jgi:pilus assembly protein Flp/PilA